MIRKILAYVVIAVMVMATPAFAQVETAENGPAHITSCFMIGTGPCTSGSVVVLSNSGTTQPTGRTIQWYGREVTGTVTAGLVPYGIVVDQNNYTATEMVNGKTIRVLVSGYTPIIRVSTSSTTASPAITAGDSIVTSSTSLVGQGNNTGAVTGNVVALTAYAAGQTTGTVRGFVGRQN